MKRIALVFLMAASATALFANGSPEAPGTADMTGPDWARSRTGFDGDFTPPADAVFTAVELTGTVEMVDDHAVLTADGKTYLLAIPRIAWYADEVADGTVITVSGNLVEGVTHDEVDFDGDGHIAVQQVEIDGEVLTLGGIGGPAGRFDVATRGNFADDDEWFGRGRYYAEDGDEMFGRGPMVDGDEWNGRGLPQGGRDDFGPQGMPRGRRI